MVDIFDEVDEELRAERAQQLLKRYGGLIVAGALLIVGAAAGWQGWRWYEARQDQAAAVRVPDRDEPGRCDRRRQQRRRTAPPRIAAFAQLAATAPEGYATLARLREAALKADAGDLRGRRGAVGPGGGRLRRPIRCCAISPACCGRSIRSTAAIRRCSRRG